jgi:hypothetical protein
MPQAFNGLSFDIFGLLRGWQAERSSEAAKSALFSTQHVDEDDLHRDDEEEADETAFWGMALYPVM